MLAIYYNENTPCILRPTPLISISQTPIRNKVGMLGSYYSIVLNGTIISDEGSPYYITGSGSSSHSEPLSPYDAFAHTYSRPNHENIHVDNAMSSIIHKQNLIRELFKKDGQRIELLPVSVDPLTTSNMTDVPVLVFYPIVESINFEEGIYINTCKYTINLRAEVLLDNSGKIISDGLVNSTLSNNGEITRNNNGQRLLLSDAIAASGFVDDYSENWSIEVEEGNGNTGTDNSGSPIITSSRAYKLTRSISATGRTMYYSENENGPVKRKEAWQQAKSYIYNSVLKDNDNDPLNNSTGYEQFPEYSLGPYFGSGFLNIAKEQWGGYNHVRTESIDVTAGTVTINDTWLLSSGNAYENYRMSLSKGFDSPIHKISIDGSIKGLSSVHAGSTQYGGSNTSTATQYGNAPLNTQYQNALYKWYQISNNGAYGPNCSIYKRAQSSTHAQLNHIPLSVSLATNEFTGDITYTVEYDSRIQNIVSGALSESINCSDTYPGDFFAVIPVIGRQTGPILQYIGGRTEYQRNLTIDLVMDRYYTSGNGPLSERIRQQSVLSKPSLNEPFKSQINSIINAYSPAQENGIRKYFINPPNESWDANSGRYSLSINWVYEVNR